MGERLVGFVGDGGDQVNHRARSVNKVQVLDNILDSEQVYALLLEYGFVDARVNLDRRDGF